MTEVAAARPSLITFCTPTVMWLVAAFMWLVAGSMPLLRAIKRI